MKYENEDSVSKFSYSGTRLLQNE